jgi:transcriptional regulator with XRE-family HTH domain
VSKAEELRQLRRGLGFTLAEVAPRAGVSIALLSYVETGKRRLDLDLYSRLLKAIQDLGEERQRNGIELMDEMGFGRRTAGMEVGK